MYKPTKLKLGISLAFVTGLCLFIGIIVYNGIDQIFAGVLIVGWGLIIITAYHLIPLILESIGWWVLLRPGQRPPFLILSWARWIGESVDTLLPVAQVGGDIVKSSLLIRTGIPGTIVGASVVVELTLTIATQAVFTIMGLVLLINLIENQTIIQALIVGIILIFALILGFYFFQHKGLFGGIARLLQIITGSDRWHTIIGNGDALDEAITNLYKDRGRILNSTFWLFMAWIFGVGEIWLGLYFLGHEVSLYEAMMIESLIQAIRAMAFFIPWAVGVQEATFLILGTAVGISADTSLALAVVRRVRELCMGIPGLIAWQVNETFRLWDKKNNIQESGTKR